MLIPFDFLKHRPNLSWGEVLWGYERQFVGWTTVVDLAVQRVDKGSDNDLEIDLAGIDKAHAYEAHELLLKLAGPTDQESAKANWLCLVLSWLWQNRGSFDDPLGQIESIYADFGYPKQMAAFVRYMPTTDGYDSSMHTHEENESRLYENWKRFVFGCATTIQSDGQAI